MALYGAKEIMKFDKQPSLRYCPECGHVYFTKETECPLHLRTEETPLPLLVMLDAELLLR
jgi:hypothetical protein